MGGLTFAMAMNDDFPHWHRGAGDHRAHHHITGPVQYRLVTKHKVKSRKPSKTVGLKSEPSTDGPGAKIHRALTKACRVYVFCHIGEGLPWSDSLP